MPHAAKGVQQALQEPGAADPTGQHGDRSRGRRGGSWGHEGSLVRAAGAGQADRFVAPYSRPGLNSGVRQTCNSNSVVRLGDRTAAKPLAWTNYTPRVGRSVSMIGIRKGLTGRKGDGRARVVRAR